MKQKILYILVMIIALCGKGEMVFGQSNVEGYKLVIKENTTSKMKGGNQWEKEAENCFYKQPSDYITFYLRSDVDLTRVSNTFDTSDDHIDATLSWKTSQDYYLVKITKLELYAYHNLFWNSPSHSINGASIKTKYGAGDGNAATSECDLYNDDYVKVITGNNDTYITYISATYKIYYYELDVTALESAITTANNALGSITDETMKGYLNTAIANAESFKTECAFPTSYWNGSSVGKTPADVTATAEKLNAITNYLIIQTRANEFNKDLIPNAVYGLLHQFEDVNPNDHITKDIIDGTTLVQQAIDMADATTSAYQKALSTIALAENSSDKTNDPTTLATDIANAKTELEEATSVDGISSALANIKKFDSISFNGSTELQEGTSVNNPAGNNSNKQISYISDNPNVIVIDGTTLKAVGAGEVTITASTTTGNGYYGYTTTQTYTVKPNGITLVPNVGCNIVENVTYPQITLQRTFSAGLHYTLTLPFDSNISEIGGDYAAQLALVTYNQKDGYTLYFQKVANGQMEANQPYVVYLPNGAKNPKWTNVTVVAPNAESIVVNGWTMQGNYTPDLKMEGKYGIAGGKLCRGEGDNAKINAYTAYFTFHGTENVRARVAVMDEGGNTTYIGELKDGVLQTEEGIYGLDGIQQNQLRKGINIVRQKDGSVRKIVK